MQYSPKLKRIAQEISAIFRREDIAGIAILHTPGFAEHILNITPSYSAIIIHPQKQIAEVRGDASNYGNDKEKRNKVLADTANMLRCISDVGGPLMLSLMELSQKVDETYNVENSEGNFSSETEQNN